MSTVAFDGRFFVADTQVTGGGMVHGFSKMKVLKDRNGKVQFVFMFTGDAMAFEPAIKAFLALPGELAPNAYDDSPGCLYAFNLLGDTSAHGGSTCANRMLRTREAADGLIYWRVGPR